jgi:hypothetical protein
MSKRIPRPSPALFISVIALFVALGGTVYAASKIDGKTIKVKSLPGNRLKPDTVTGAQVSESSLAQVPTAKRADTAGRADSAAQADKAVNALNADSVDGRSAECQAGTVFFNGGCWEINSNAKVDAPVAAQACAAKGGSLPLALDLRSYVKQTALDLGATGEWTDNVFDVTSEDAYSVVIVSKTGVINFTVQTDDHQFRCVLPLVR